MTTPAELYVNGVKKKLANYFAAWLPGEKLRLGDVGVIRGNLFNRITSLENLGIKFEQRNDESSTPIDYVSESGVTIYFKAAGELNSSLPNVPEGKAGIGIEFSQEGAFIIKAPKSYQPSIENIAQLEEDIIKEYKNGNWRSEWTVITRLIHTPIASIIVSNSSKSKVEFTAEANVSVSEINLGDATLQFGLVSQRGDVIKFLKAEDLTPLFQLAQLKNKYLLFGKELSIKFIGMQDTNMSSITPSLVKNNKDVEASLYIDLVRDQDLLA